MNVLLQSRIVSQGEWYFGFTPETVSTLLGSCVAVTAWHSRLRCGGMCHYLLPHKSRYHSNGDHHLSLNPRYGEDALTLLSAELTRHAPLAEYAFGYFGGATMFKGNQHIGASNVDLAIHWLRDRQLNVHTVSVGGNRGKKIVLDLETGNILINEVNTLLVGVPDGHQCTGSG